MSTVWMSLLKFALSVAVTAISRISPDQWAKVGTVLIAWIQNLENKLPPGNPLFAVLNSYRAPSHKLQPPKAKPEADLWGD
jgi:hypothetical protein